MNRAKAEEMCADLLKAVQADKRKYGYSKEDLPNAVNADLPKAAGADISSMMKVLEKYGVVKKEKKADYECEGQMNITDYPEYMPEDYEL